MSRKPTSETCPSLSSPQPAAFQRHAPQRPRLRAAARLAQGRRGAAAAPAPGVQAGEAAGCSSPALPAARDVACSFLSPAAATTRRGPATVAWRLVATAARVAAGAARSTLAGRHYSSPFPGGSRGSGRRRTLPRPSNSTGPCVTRRAMASRTRPTFDLYAHAITSTTAGQMTVSTSVTRYSIVRHVLRRYLMRRNGNSTSTSSLSSFRSTLILFPLRR